MAKQTQSALRADFHFAALVWALLVAAGAARADVSLPPGFETIAITPSLNKPVAIAFADDGRLFVAEQSGVVRVIENGNLLPNKFIDLRPEVNLGGDRGLLGIALDPDFMSNRYVYLLYTVDPIPGSPNEPGLTATFSRLTRYKGTAESHGNVAGLASRKILIGKTPSQGFPACYSAHTIAALRFAPDKSLLISAGDGASFQLADGGGNTPGCFAPGLFGAAQDIGSFRAQSLNSLDGKLLRIKRGTGEGYSNNPYWDGNANSIRSRIWAYGLRNPFRFTFKPGAPGIVPTIYVGDVGWQTYEEVDVVHGAENFGWPCFEGIPDAPDFPGLNPANSGCNTIGTPGNPGSLTGPLLAWHHSNANLSTPQGFTGHCAIGGVFYTGNSYPALYQGAYFFADYIGDWIKILKVDNNDQFVSLNDVATSAGGPVDFAIDPVTGDVCYIALNSSKVLRIHYSGSNLMAAPGGSDAEPAGNPDQINISSSSANCPADIAPPGGDGVVDITDLLAVFNNSGNSGNSNGDQDQASHSVNIEALLAVINAWGPCP